MSKRQKKCLNKIDGSITRIRNWIDEDGHNMTHMLYHFQDKRMTETNKIGRKKNEK